MIIVHWKASKFLFNEQLISVELRDLDQCTEFKSGEGKRLYVIGGGGDAGIVATFSSTQGDVGKLYETFLSAMGKGKNITIFSGKEKKE